MLVYADGVYREMNKKEAESLETLKSVASEHRPSPEERIAILEETKADQTDVDELNEALNMILTGVTE